MPDRFETNGQEILKDGKHFADFHCPAAAEATTIMLNHGRFFTGDVTDSQVEKVLEALWV